MADGAQWWCELKSDFIFDPFTFQSCINSLFSPPVSQDAPLNRSPKMFIVFNLKYTVIRGCVKKKQLDDKGSEVAEVKKETGSQRPPALRWSTLATLLGLQQDLLKWQMALCICSVHAAQLLAGGCRQRANKHVVLWRWYKWHLNPHHQHLIQYFGLEGKRKDVYKINSGCMWKQAK